jgi:hypothetical protein
VAQYPWRRNLQNIVPAMIVAVQAPDGRIVAIEATALIDDGTGKRFGKHSRDKTGELASGAVRFAAATDVLGLAEGVETAIAAMDLTGVPCWASLGAARMHLVAIPQGVRTLHIFADDDDAGRAAAERTADAHPTIRKIIRLPPVGFTDWNDLTMAQEVR